MSTMQIDNTRIKWADPIVTPNQLKELISPEKDVVSHIINSRKITSSIMNGLDCRLLTIVWPCSIHNPEEGLEYAKRLAEIQEKYPNLFIVMRTYFEKPRTTVWWKGLINDPNLNWTFDMSKWIEIARQFLLDVNEIWLPTATEFLDPIISQYIADLIAWWAIWARTTESQIHREMASWLSCPIWFKNWTDGCEQTAIDAIWAAKWNHSFLWIDGDWKSSIMRTTWNNEGHMILRWWKTWSNFNEESVKRIVKKLIGSWVNPNVIVDASHDNSKTGTKKQHENQMEVAKIIWEQIRKWNIYITWIMMEGNHNPWKQKFNPLTDYRGDLTPWTSITDACMSFDQTEEVLHFLNESAWTRN